METSPPKRGLGWVIERVRRITPRQGLWLLILGYFVVSLGFSELRYLEIRTTNWDFGIAEQALWSSSHGHLLYEAGDYESYGVSSLLQVHTAFILFLVIPIYAVAPDPLTLFILQSSVIALAMLPLYRLTHLVTGSSRRALLVTAIYAIWIPILSSNLYDVHLEALLPLELLTLFLLWFQGRYALGCLVALLALATIEVTPVLIFAMALFFLLPPIRGSIRRGVSIWSSATPGHRIGLLGKRTLRALRGAMKLPRVQASFLLALGCVVAYYSLRYLQLNAPSIFLGQPVASGSSFTGLTPAGLGISFSNLSGSIYSKVTYWLILFATLAFVPLRAPRSLILVAPWVIFTFCGSPLGAFVELGQQYGLVAAAPMMVAFVFGIRDLPLPPVRETLRAWWNTPSSGEVAPRAFARAHLQGETARLAPNPGLWTLALTTVIVLNILGSPVDPLVQNAGLGNGYEVSYFIPQGYDEVQQLAHMIPPGSTLVATDDLFPFVANDLHAYSLLWYPAVPAVFPFSPTSLPPYVFVSQERDFSIPGWLLPMLFNSSDYGVRATTGISNAGTVYLFQAGYQGPTLNLLPPLPPPKVFPATSLTPGFAARFLLGSHGSPTVIEATGNETGQLWYGPNFKLAAGEYEFNFTVRAFLNHNVSSGSASDSSTGGPGSGGSSTPPNATTPILSLNVTGFGLASGVQTTIPWSNLSSGEWENVSLIVDTTHPCLDMQFFGWQWTTSVVVQLEQVTSYEIP